MSESKLIAAWVLVVLGGGLVFGALRAHFARYPYLDSKGCEFITQFFMWVMSWILGSLIAVAIFAAAMELVR